MNLKIIFLADDGSKINIWMMILGAEASKSLFYICVNDLEGGLIYYLFCAGSSAPEGIGNLLASFPREHNSVLVALFHDVLGDLHRFFPAMALSDGDADEIDQG